MEGFEMTTGRSVTADMVTSRQTQEKVKLGITEFLNMDAVKSQVNQAVGKNSMRFMSSVISAVTVNPALQECTNKSILLAALLGESLNLSPSPQLGQYYMVPYTKKAKYGKNGEIISPETTEAQFQMGYKGYIQLAIRSGQYRRINVLAIKEGELKYFDPLNEEIKVELMVDRWDEREEAPTIGYYAMFELANGFYKAMYWSKKQMLYHADKYSQAFSKDAKEITVKGEKKKKVSFADFEAGNYSDKDAWLYSSFWYQNFDGMAYKTMLRQLISKWGVMSIEMQKAFDADMAVIHDESKQYVDNEPDDADTYVDATVSDRAEDAFAGKEKKQADGQQELNLEGGANEIK